MAPSGPEIVWSHLQKVPPRPPHQRGRIRDGGGASEDRRRQQGVNSTTRRRAHSVIAEDVLLGPEGGARSNPLAARDHADTDEDSIAGDFHIPAARSKLSGDGDDQQRGGEGDHRRRTNWLTWASIPIPRKNTVRRVPDRYQIPPDPI